MLTDVNLYFSRWPTRRLPYDEPQELVEKLKERGVTAGWIGSFDALLHEDIAAVNANLVDQCRRHGEGWLLPFGTINPTLPDWQEDVRRCAEQHRMPGVRLHPDYHGYTLEDARFRELLDLCQRTRLIVQLAVSMEDARTQHPRLLVPPVDLRPLAKALRDRPAVRMVLLNAQRSVALSDLASLVHAAPVWIDIATQESIAGLGKLLQQIPLDRVLFGSYAPFFHFESAWLKLRESELAGVQQEAITHGNAEKLLASIPA